MQCPFDSDRSHCEVNGKSWCCASHVAPQLANLFTIIAVYENFGAGRNYSNGCKNRFDVLFGNSIQIVYEVYGFAITHFDEDGDAFQFACVTFGKVIEYLDEHFKRCDNQSKVAIKKEFQ